MTEGIASSHSFSKFNTYLWDINDNHPYKLLIKPDTYKNFTNFDKTAILTIEIFQLQTNI